MQPYYLSPPCGLKCILLLLIVVEFSDSLVSFGSLPRELQDCYNSYARYSLRDVVGQSVCWSCEAPVIRRLRTSSMPSLVTASSTAYVRHLKNKVSEMMYRSRVKRETLSKCRRKEYRMLTDEERKRFHRALNILKNDTTTTPNKYDSIAIQHSGPAIPSAHGGPNFLGWHRVFLNMLEAALREVDPRVCLPYWDSSLDSELDDPSSSYVFSPDFLGGGGSNGPVMDGPFAGWVTPNFGQLTRNIGAIGDLYDADEINNILSQRRTAAITPPNGSPQNGLEFHHNGVHVFIGGQMNNLQAAAHDPAFFLHHCFVDYIWEVFRTQQRAAGIDPQLDYPEDFGSLLHAPNRDMGFDMNITAIQGYADNLTDTFEYEPSPSCSRGRPSCGSKYLQCNVESGRCIPIKPVTTTPYPHCPIKPTCPSEKYCKKSPKGIQNTYCIDGVCDTRGWVYIPVEIVSVRSPDLKDYPSYPVYNGSIRHTADIYSPSAFGEARQFDPKEIPKGYDKCHDGEGIGQVYVQSNGLSYEGFYKESSIVDQRLATSIAIAYVAVKNPRNGPVKVLVRAFDSCGRICQPGCRVPRTNTYEPCSGVLDIADVHGRPKQYSETYGKATFNTWRYSSNQRYPSFRHDDILLTFYCDYSDNLPWVTAPSQPIPPPTTTTPKPTLKKECRIDSECTINAPCVTGKSVCFRGRHKCRDSCNKYAICRRGRYVKTSCPSNWSFDKRRSRCDRRRRCFRLPKNYRRLD